ncbi:glycine zipper family protein [Candidatus Wolbachia massiliensis]|uniref:Glycine zipper family protein n=1 Tax=Candidatus Wolbachia massiliensis TaxID=1845000 RepID=A0A7L7YRI1_9RICK|nr:glycine zipper family protein [Candidatus Wolbachia massiliensis]QOD38277.1 glycine zipper family protein [Candidatus Wolbachia massiliensis]
MVQGGATDAGSEYLAQGLIELVQGNEGLQAEAKKFLSENEDLKDLDLTKVENVVDLLNGDKSKDFLETVSQKLSEEEKFKKLVEQIGKNLVMVEKLDALGNQLLINRIIGGAAFTTLTGALAGTLAIGGVAGALITGGAALAGFLAILAIAAIGYVIYQYRGEIKEGLIEAGKAIKSFVKNLIDKLPTFQNRNNNFYKLYQELSQLIVDTYGSEKEGEAKNALDKAKVIEMLQNEEQRSAIGELVKEGVIGNFSKEDMDRLIEKGNSTHEADKDALNELMDKFQPAITAIGENDIKKVEQKVSEKVEEMRPKSQVDDPDSEQTIPKERITPS